MFTRKQYMENKCTHSEYYGQFVTALIKEVVKERIGIRRILNSTDEHWNDIPLIMWDKLEPQIKPLLKDRLRAAGDFYSLSATVCTAKQAARMLFDEITSV